MTVTFMFPVRCWPLTSVKFKCFCHVFMSDLYFLLSVSFDIGIPYLTHGPITMRGCVKYIHDPDRTLTFDLKIKFIGLMTWLCVQVSVSFPLTKYDYHTLFGMWVYHHGTMCRVHSWTLYELDRWPQHPNYIFTWIWVWQDVFAL